jgi:tetratricopeptide (TPR) repeat protein
MDAGYMSATPRAPWRILAPLLVVVTCWPAVAHGQASQAGSSDGPAEAYDQEARTLFQAGTMAYSDGRFEEAMRLFEKSYELSRRPSLLFNIASAAERLRMEAEAVAAYEKYLEQVQDAPNRKFVESRLEVLRRQLERQASQEQAAAQGAEPTAVPSPAEAARAESTGFEAGTREPVDSPPITRRWWFWTSVGAIVVAGVVLGVLLGGSRSGAGGEYPSDTVGGTIFTLGVGP